MTGLSREIEEILVERFGKDTVVALATVEDGVPYVREVNAYYEGRAFYVVTYGLSNKMRQIGKNPMVAVCGEWFSGHGVGVNLGYFGKEENAPIAGKLREVFAAWIGNGHTDLSDSHTCILRIELRDGVLFSQGARFDVDFTR